MPADSPITVVIADDHPAIVDSLSRAVAADPRLALQACAADGHAALEAIATQAPDIALIDLRMPGLDGIEIVERLARDRVPTRVILFSGHLEGATAYLALQAGASGVVSKLSGPSAVIRAIVAVAGGETVIGAELQDLVAAEIRTRAGRVGVQLTAREREILGRVADGESVPTMAAALYLSPSTVKKHLESLYRKLEVSDRAAAVAEAMRRGLLR